MQDNDLYLRRKDAATYLHERFGEGSASSLAKLAVTGGGPRYFKYGRKSVFYLRSDLDAWATSRMVPRFSTSDDASGCADAGGAI